MAQDETALDNARSPRMVAAAAGLAILGGALVTLGFFNVSRLAEVASVVVPVLRPVEEPPAPAQAAAPHAAQPLLAWLRDRDYRLEDVRQSGRPVPRVILTSLPDDLETMASVDERKNLFVKTMLPLVLLVNEPIERDRARLEGLNELVESGVALAPRDRRWVTELADRYGFARPETAPIPELLKRVDVVPVSMAIAQAAEESGWGTSRIARAGNAVFGQQTWGAEGIVPQVRRPGETFKYQKFDTLLAGVASYVHNLNTHDAYREFRLARASLRQGGKALDSVRLLASMSRYSERGADYIQAVRTLIRGNDLQDFDRAKLHDGEPELVIRVDRDA